MTVALKIRVIHLLTKFAADAFVVLTALKSAGTIASAAPESFLYVRDQRGVGIKMKPAHFASFIRARTVSLSA